MDSAVRTGTRLRALLVRVVVTAGFVVAAWLLGSLMAGSASASTHSADADTAANPTDSGLVGDLLGGLTQTVGDVLGGTPADDQSGSDDATTTPPSSSDTTLPDLLPVLGSSTGVASTSPAVAPAESVVHKSERASVRVESRPAATGKPAHVDRPRHAAVKRVASVPASKPKSSPAPADDSRRAGAPIPPAPPAPQAPPAPSAAVSGGHDSTQHGKSWFLAAVGDATLTPPTATGTAIDHRATAVARDRDRPATAPD